MLEENHGLDLVSPLPALNPAEDTARNVVGLNDFKSIFRTALRGAQPLSPLSRQRSIAQGVGGGGALKSQISDLQSSVSAYLFSHLHLPKNAVCNLFVICTYVSKGLKPRLKSALTKNTGVPPLSPHPSHFIPRTSGTFPRSTAYLPTKRGTVRKEHHR